MNEELKVPVAHVAQRDLFRRVISSQFATARDAQPAPLRAPTAKQLRRR